MLQFSFALFCVKSTAASDCVKVVIYSSLSYAGSMATCYDAAAVPICSEKKKESCCKTVVTASSLGKCADAEQVLLM